MTDFTYERVIELVKSLPAEKLSSLYDFALYLKERRSGRAVGDLFGETEEEILADAAWWDEQFELSDRVLLQLAEEAAEDYNAGRTEPMDFDQNGHLRR